MCPQKFKIIRRNLIQGQSAVCIQRDISMHSVLYGTAARAETTSTTQGLSKLQAQELVLRLNDEERSVLISALQEYHSKLVKDEYEGKLNACYLFPLVSEHISFNKVIKMCS